MSLGVARLQHATEIEGLSQAEVQAQTKFFGLNVLTEKKKISPLKLLLAQFKDMMVLILLASTVLSIVMGEMTEALAIIAIVVINAVLGFMQEFRTEKTMDALKDLAAPTARVVREGKLVHIPAKQLVPNDVIFIQAGDRIPADAKLLEVASLQVDESILTGESLPVEKTITGQNTKPYIYMGTLVTKGKAKAMVVATGMRTEMGKIADMLQGIEDEQTPLQIRLNQLGKLIAYGCLAICAIVSLTGILRGEPIFDMLITGISLAVAAVPEGLPAIVTIALALGVGRMLKRNALIRKLTAVETLGCAGVVCSDKTGTLTENKMTVKKLYTYDNTVAVSGSGFDRKGDFYVNGVEVEGRKIEAIRLALEISTLCNNAEITVGVQKETGEGRFKRFNITRDVWQVDGDPTEGALLIAAAKAGILKEELLTYTRIVQEIPFDSDRKCMSVVLKNEKGMRVMTKGAPDIILEKCSSILTKHGVVALTGSMHKQIMQANDEMAEQALRVLAMAYKELARANVNSAEIEQNLVFVGLSGMIDPPRLEAYEAVRKCKKAGIKPVMITGDYKGTAAAIAKELGILKNDDLVLTGKELDQMSEAELLRIAPKTSVFARVSPGHKLQIVKAYKKLGHVVAMTGDGVNDAPAVKEADIGVSMGISGTDVTKESSAMILMDDNFATLIAAVEEGRVIYRNIRKFIRYLLSCNIGEVLTMFVGMLMGLPIVLMPIQILWVNLVTDGLPAIALGLEPPEKDIMSDKPRGAKDGIFSDGLLNMIVFRGCMIGLSTLGAFITTLNQFGDVDTARTVAFLTLVIAQLIHVFECKSEKKSIFHIQIFSNPALIAAVLCSLCMILAVIYIPTLQDIFKTVPLDLEALFWVAGFSALGPVVSTWVFGNKK
ncbi:MAG: cation-translocating P-type ATPase [Hyphomonadaceae bacterium]|nr:cation-translocating P-type ATPase [Clostridia bacterium]